MRIAMLVTLADVETPFFSIDLELDNVPQAVVLNRLAKQVVELISEDGYHERAQRMVKPDVGTTGDSRDNMDTTG
jgi:hypothetical protein